MRPGEGHRTLARLVADAAARITRLDLHEAAAAVRDGAVLVDIRSDLSRTRDGAVPGSLHIPRTVLEWRLARDSAWRNPYVPDGARIVVLCDHGCSSVLAAATLVDLGFEDAADVVGGFTAWRAAGLPVVAQAPPDPEEPAGMRGVDPVPPG